MNFSDEENVLILCISGSKRRSFSRQEIGKKIFLQYLLHLHDILRTQDRRSFSSEKNDNMIFFCCTMEYHVYQLLESSGFELSGDGNMVFFTAKKFMEIRYLLITGKFLFRNFRWWEIRPFQSQKVDGKMFTDC